MAGKAEHFDVDGFMERYAYDKNPGGPKRMQAGSQGTIYTEKVPNLIRDVQSPSTDPRTGTYADLDHDTLVIDMRYTLDE